jgi:hypothetical protein
MTISPDETMYLEYLLVFVVAYLVGRLINS